jgi:hypothetical protein
MSMQERVEGLKTKINEAWDDPRPSRPSDDVFSRIEALHADAIAPKNTGA